MNKMSFVKKAVITAACIALCLQGPHLLDFLPGGMKYLAHAFGQSAAWVVLAAAAVFCLPLLRRLRNIQTLMPCFWNVRWYNGTMKDAF